MKLLLNITFFLTACFFTSSSFALTVIKFNDTNDGVCDKDCSLREAVIKANATPGKDEIRLLAGTYVLDIPLLRAEEGELFDEDANENGDLDITDDVDIIGSYTGVTILDGANNDRIIDIISGSIYLKNLTLTHGLQTEYGGAIENHGLLTLRYCSVIKNVASGAFSPGAGGGIANWGTLNIYSSEISENIASAGEAHRGSGGGIYNLGNLKVRDSTIRANWAIDDDSAGFGSGIFNKGIVDIRRSLFTQNYASSFGYGGAILNIDGGVVRIVSSTISNNSGGEDGRGAIANGTPSWAPGKLYLKNVTIADNANYGVYSRGDLYIRNSIIAGNARPSDGLSQNCYREGGKFEIHDLLLGEGENTGCFGTYSIENNKTFTTLLDALAHNGGRTLTHALRKGSFAIDRSEEGQCPLADQRGLQTNMDGDKDGVGKCDLGAVEYHQ